MQTREEMEKRIAKLERALGRGGYGVRGVRIRSAAAIAGFPLYAIAMGPDIENEELRGHAKGVIAIGDVATGVIAIGGIARGVVALGGFAFGLFALGGFSIAALVAAGGIAIGGIAAGGAALGGVAVGGAVGGYYACGAAAVGDHVVTSTATRSDVQAERFFREHGLASYCGVGHVYGKSTTP
jgi:hypothetical protein